MRLKLLATVALVASCVGAGAQDLPRHHFKVLIQDSLQLPDPPAWPLALPDLDDAVFLALAEMAGAVLVTGNTADYPRDRCARVVVMNPANYLRALEAAS